MLGASGNFDVLGTATISVPIASGFLGTGTGNGLTANPFGITKTGAGTLFLTNTGNNFTGGTTVNAGTLNLGTGGGTGVVRGILTVNAGASLILSGNNAIGFNGPDTSGNPTSVTTLNVNGGTVDSTAVGTGFNQGYLTSFNLTGATVSSSGGATYNFNVAAGAATPTITSNASATTSTISGGVVVRNVGTLAFTVASGAAGTTNGSDLTVSGVISGSGTTSGISKAGAGAMLLTATNTYTGTTTISAGTLLTSGTGTLGAGNVAITGGALTLGSSVSFADTATLGFAGASTITLNNTTADTLSYIADTNTAQVAPRGTYTAGQLDTLFGVTSFTGSGSLIVSVPEPSTWVGALMLVGTCGLARRRWVAAKLG